MAKSPLLRYLRNEVTAADEATVSNSKMHFKQILFPTDLSHCDDGPLALATSLGRDSGASLLMVHVEEIPVSYWAGRRFYGRRTFILIFAGVLIVWITINAVSLLGKRRRTTGARS